MHYKFDSTPSWEIDDNGFMRCRARFMSTGVMEYAEHELGGLVDSGNPDKLYNIFVGQDTLSDPKAIRSLEGMPVIIGHEWAGPDAEYSQSGSIAGTPKVNGPYLEGEIVITDPLAIEAIQAGELKDISAAYNAGYVFEGGSHDGQDFDGKQKELRYNHVALLPPGSGRAGVDVRVLNKKGKSEMSDSKLTAVQIKEGTIVRVLNEDVQKMNEAVQETANMEKETKQSMANMEETLAKLETANTELETKNAEIAELKGSLEAMKERLENALNPEALEAAAAELAEEKEEAAEMLAENGDYENKKEAMNSIQGLSGHALREAVINKIRAKNGKPELDHGEADEATRIATVNGMYAAYKDMPAATKKAVSGANMARAAVKNSAGKTQERTTGQRLGFAKKENK